MHVIVKNLFTKSSDFRAVGSYTSMPNERKSSNFAESQHNFYFLPHFILKTTEPIFAIFLHDEEQLVELGDGAFHCRTREQRVKTVNFDVCEKIQN